MAEVGVVEVGKYGAGAAQAGTARAADEDLPIQISMGQGTAETTTPGTVKQRVMDAVGVQGQQCDSEVNDGDLIFVDCIDTRAITDQRHDCPSGCQELDPSQPAHLHSRPNVKDGSPPNTMSPELRR